MMTPEEFAAKCEAEGVEYAVTEYGLSANDLEPGTELHTIMLDVDAAKRAWMRAIGTLEDAIEEWL